MQISVATLFTLAVAVSAVKPMNMAKRVADAGIAKRDIALPNGFTAEQLHAIVESFDHALTPQGEDGAVEKRQGWDQCPLEKCQDRCNFAPPFCFGEFCDFNTLGCLAGCCVACGGC